jgi:hypothetical protein
MDRTGQHRTARAQSLRPIVIGFLLGLVALLLSVSWTGGALLANILQPGNELLSGRIAARDLGIDPIGGLGHDGQQNYLIARSPTDADLLVDGLDRPLYRIQRPMLPAFAWLLHPTGGGPGLAAAFLVVGLLAWIGGGLAMRSVATSLGAPGWLGGLFPVLPGAWIACRITVSDGLMMALVLAALAASLKQRHRTACLAAIGAVLAKEAAVLIFVGLWLWRRDRARTALVVVPLGVSAAWAGIARLHVGGADPELREFAPPMLGYVRATAAWMQGEHLFALLCTVVSAMLVIAVLLRRRRHPLRWAVLLQVPMLVTLDRAVIGLDLNAPRALLPCMALGALALATPRGAILSSESPPLRPSEQRVTSGVRHG